MFLSLSFLFFSLPAFRRQRRLVLSRFVSLMRLCVSFSYSTRHPAPRKKKRQRKCKNCRKCRKAKCKFMFHFPLGFPPINFSRLSFLLPFFILLSFIFAVLFACPFLSLSLYSPFSSLIYLLLSSSLPLTLPPPPVPSSCSVSSLVSLSLRVLSLLSCLRERHGHTSCRHPQTSRRRDRGRRNRHSHRDREQLVRSALPSLSVLLVFSLGRCSCFAFLQS